MPILPAAEINHRFDLQPPRTPDVGGLMDETRASYKALATFLARELPGGREQSLALTHLEEGLFWAIAAIARNQP
jgi:hypothetical protein